MASGEPQAALARRLRQLREEHWSVRVTQSVLAKALGVSAPLISSWENKDDSATPPLDRLEDYATFFATRRSVDRSGPRLMPVNDLGEDERATREKLVQELTALREKAVRVDSALQPVRALGGSWHFDDGWPVRIVCAEVPEEQRNPDSSPAHPTLVYGELYDFSNIDALAELHGHIRAANPRSDVRIYKESELQRDDYVAHLVVLGGIDMNVLGTRLQEDSRLGVPIRQVSTGGDPADAFFETGTGEDAEQHQATMRNGDLQSDVAQFLRTRNPYNQSRTLSVCRGLFSLGTYGAVRALTDTRFRGRNEDYLHRRFAGRDSFSVLMRVDVLNGDEALTPDWTVRTTRLYEWPAEAPQ